MSHEELVRCKTTKKMMSRRKNENNKKYEMMH